MNSSSNDPFQLVKQISGWLVAITGFVATIAGFIQTVQGNLSLYTTLLLIVGVGLLWLVCLYYARFWKPQVEDQGAAPPSLLLLEQNWQQDEQSAKQREQEQAKREKRRKRVKRSATIGLMIIPILAVAGFFGWQQIQNRPSKDTIVLVAEFQNEQTAKDDYAVTNTIWENLENAVDEYDDVKLMRAKTPFENSESARSAGEDQKASIVIWGWYGKTEQAVPISANFELLRPFQTVNEYEIAPELGDAVKGQVRRATPAELENLTLQTQLSGEMSYLTLFVLGMTQYANKDWDQAVEHFSEALNQVDGEVEALKQSVVYNFRGRSHYWSDYYRNDYTNRFESAIADFTKATELDPEYATAYYNRGVVYDIQGNYEQAIADYTTAIALDPEYANAYYNRGLAYGIQGNYEQAIADSNKVVELDSQDASVYINRGWFYYEQGNYEQAIVDYNKAIALSPDDALGYNERGSVYTALENLDQALTDYNKAIELDPENAYAYNSRGFAYLRKGELNKALADLNRALELNPELAYSYFGRGQIYQQQGKKAEAIKDFKQFLQLTEDTTSKDYLDYRKQAEEQLRQFGAM